ncbi:MAG: hypothetical protein ABUL62_13720 [Myxococcales bacterium]
MIRKISTSVGMCLLLGAALPGVGCGSFDPAPFGGGSAAGANGAVAASAGSSAHPSAGAAATPGGAGNPSAGAANANAGAGPSCSGAGGAFMSVGGASSNGGAPANAAGAPTGGGAPPNVGGATGASGSASGGAPAGGGCDTAGLVWKSANKTNYTSYPEPGSDECVEYSGCLYEGLFEACEKKQTLDWVKTHNIVAAFPLQGLELHDLCLIRQRNDRGHGLRYLR